MGKSLALIAILCLSACLFGSAYGTETSTSMLRGLQLIQMQTGYVVDDILAFLKSFETDIFNQISHLDEAVRVETEYLEQLIKDLEVQREGKLDECARIKTETEEVVKEYNKQLDFVNWITKRINEDYEKIENYHKQSCQQTLDFVEYLRNAQNALNLIEFLRKSLTDYSFTQLRPLALVLKNYSQDQSLYSSSKGLQLMLLQFQAAISHVDSSAYHSGDSLNDRVHSRTGEEIGTGHVDNDQDNIEVDGFNGGRRMGINAMKAELFKILDALEATIKKNMNDKINNMITLAETTAEYIIILEKEIEYLQKELVHQQEVLREIELRVKEGQAIVDQCYVEYDQLVAKIKDTKEKHDNYIKDKSTYREVLLDQLDQLSAIINLYETKIASAGENYKTRYDDILDNEVIDYTAHVDERELKIEYNDLQNPDDLDNDVEEDIVPTPYDENDESIAL